MLNYKKHNRDFVRGKNREPRGQEAKSDERITES
jgi:hypothetical protein